MPSSYISVVGGLGLSVTLLYILKQLLTYKKKKVCLQDKVVLITGASSGVGEACAHVFYQAGAKVILCARRLKELERVKADLLSSTPKQGVTVYEPCIVTLDLADIGSMQAKVTQALGLHGNIDILINNGGIGYRGEVTNTTIDVDMQVMKVNYFGTVALTKALLPSMMSRRQGQIVFVSSIQGRIAVPFRSAYAASKHALQAFCDSLRAEVADHDVVISVVSPSWIHSNLSVNAVKGDGSQYGAMDSTTESGMTTHYVAKSILAAVMNHDSEVILFLLTHKLAMKIRILWPSLFFLLMKSRAAKERKEKLKRI